MYRLGSVRQRYALPFVLAVLLAVVLAIPLEAAAQHVLAVPIDSYHLTILLRGALFLALFPCTSRAWRRWLEKRRAFAVLPGGAARVRRDVTNRPRLHARG